MRLFVEKWRRIYKSISNLKNKIDNYTHFLKFPNKIRSYFFHNKLDGKIV